MDPNVNSGVEVSLSQVRHLLCEHCKAVVTATAEANDALRRLQKLTGQTAIMPALPAQVVEPTPDWMGKPGNKLSRDQRVEKAKHLLERGQQAKPPKPEHRTLNGTRVTAPHLLLPRKQITARAEADIEKVLAGSMTTKRWIGKHGYSAALLRKRLEMRGAKDPKERTRDGYNLVPGYEAPKDRVSEADLRAAMSGEVTVRSIATKYGLPAGTIYRLIGALQKTSSQSLRRGPGRPPKEEARGAQDSLFEEDESESDDESDDESESESDKAEAQAEERSTRAPAILDELKNIASGSEG